MEAIYNFLLPYAKSNYIQHRIVTASVLAEFVLHCQHNKPLLKSVLDSLVACLSDAAVKLNVLRGLGNVSSCEKEEINAYASTVLDALTSSMEDVNEKIALEAMAGLSKIFAVVDQGKVSPILVNICHRAKPAFDKDDPDIRESAFTLFGSLSRFGVDSDASTQFIEQLHNNMPVMLLHINDENIGVQNSCKSLLRKVSFLLDENQAFKTLFEHRSLNENTSFPDFESFLDDVCKLITEYHLDKVTQYAFTIIEQFKSKWSFMKRGAALFTGRLLHNIPMDQRQNITLNPSLVTHALVSLLKDKSPEVRISTAKALSLLYSY